MKSNDETNNAGGQKMVIKKLPIGGRQTSWLFSSMTEKLN